MTKNEVIIYSTEWCAFCRTLKQYLDSKNIAYTEKDIDADEAAKDELLKKCDGVFQGVPTTDFAGEMIVGFDRKKIDQIIKEKSLA